MIITTRVRLHGESSREVAEGLAHLSGRLGGRDSDRLNESPDMGETDAFDRLSSTKRTSFLYIREQSISMRFLSGSTPADIVVVAISRPAILLGAAHQVTEIRKGLHPVHMSRDAYLGTF